MCADRNLFYGISAIRHYPFDGSAIEIWDSGPGRVQEPSLGNCPADRGATNIDPRQDPRDTLAAQQQISDYLEPNGAVVDVCGGGRSRTSVFTLEVSVS